VTAYSLFMIIAIILMVLGSIPLPSRVNLWQLGWAFVILAVAFGGGVVLR
jgi:hypothetical protein